MTIDEELDRAIAKWLADSAPARMPDRVLDATFEQTRRRRQVIDWGARLRTVPRSVPALGGVAAVLVAVGLALQSVVVMSPPTTPPTPTPAASPSPSQGPTSGGMWPQTTLEEVRQAQARADAGDPDVMWQVTGVIEIQLAQHHPKDAPIFLRFLEDKLGWTNYRWDEAFAHPDGMVDGDVVYVRCATGDGTDRDRLPDRRLQGCEPSAEDGGYETVKINIAQLDRKGPGGIWVVTAWEILPPMFEVAPPTEAEIRGSLGAFLQARVDGRGAEAFVDLVESEPLAEDRVDRDIPLLYATSDGSAYERWEFDLVEGPEWPSGTMWFEVRLFTEGDASVVTQPFSLERDDADRLRVVYRFQPTTEDGRLIPVTYTFLDGVVTYGARPPLGPSQDGDRTRDRLVITGMLPGDDAPRRVLVMLADPRPIGPDCAPGSAPENADALARSLRSDPDLQATTPMAVTVDGQAGLQLDVVATGPNACFTLLEGAPFTIGSDRARVTIVELPPGSGAGVLALVTITDEDSFEAVSGVAAEIIQTIGIKTPS